MAKIKITKDEIQEIEDGLFNSNLMNQLYKEKFSKLDADLLGEDYEVNDLMGLITDHKNLLHLPSDYELDDLTKIEYENIRREFYHDYQECYEHQKSKGYSIIQPMGIYIPYSSDDGKIVLDLNEIRRVAENYNYDFDLLRRFVLYHELGHRITRFGECRNQANNSTFFNNLYYQELIAQLISYHCLSDKGRDLIADLSEHQPKEYRTWKDIEFESFKDSSLELFRLILSIQKEDLNMIHDVDSLKKIVKGIKLKEESKILDEFKFLSNKEIDIQY